MECGADGRCAPADGNCEGESDDYGKKDGDQDRLGAPPSPRKDSAPSHAARPEPAK